MDFEWNGAKELANRRKHGVDFRAAARIFLRPLRNRVRRSRRCGERRFIINAIGLVDGRLLSITYTTRGDVVRIISARSRMKKGNITKF
jgi:uncharacterized protein